MARITSVLDICKLDRQWIKVRVRHDDTWHYAYVDHPQWRYTDTGREVGTRPEKGDTLPITCINELDFIGFIVETTTPDEVRGKKFV